MSSPITLALVGDVMLGRNVDSALAERGPAWPWGDVRPVLERADAVLINLECAITSRTEEWTDRTGVRKTFYFRTEPERGMACLHEGAVACASLANNHVGDFGDAGLLDTVETLGSAGIAHAGAGSDAEAAARPARFDVAVTRVAMVAFSDHPAAWEATATSPGINFLPGETPVEAFDAVAGAIAAAREGADVVICSLHWGPNMRQRPPREFRTFARHVIDSGADILFGHSAHLVHGVEIYQGKPILYDTGDFVDDYAVTPSVRNDLSAVFLVRIAAPVIERVEILPVVISTCQVNQARREVRRWFASRFTSLCEEMGTVVHDDGERLHVQLGPSQTPEGMLSP
jgi:poly-gamma-glutamate synthesis protein (capsule biosynthesis protein)